MKNNTEKLIQIKNPKLRKRFLELGRIIVKATEERKRIIAQDGQSQ